MNERDGEPGSALETNRGHGRGPLGAFLASLDTGDATGAPPPELRRLALGVLARTPRRGDVDLAQDIVAELLARLVAPRGNGRSPAYRDLVALPESELRRIIGTRMRQIAAELTPRWALYKQLREHVALAIEEPAANADTTLPTDLLEHGRFSSARIATAVAASVCEAGSTRATTEITRRLFDAYFPPDLSLDAVPAAVRLPAASDDGERVCDAVDAEVALRRIRRRLGVDLTRIASQRLAGWGYQRIADANGMAVATAHARLGEVTRRLRPVANSFSSGALRFAFERLLREQEQAPKKPEAFAVMRADPTKGAGHATR